MFEPSSEMKVQTEGMYPPRGKEDASPFEYRPFGKFDVLRWIWHPQTGQFILSASPSHALMIPSNPNGTRSKFTEWVRGFWEPDKKRIMIRPYFNPPSTNQAMEWTDDDRTLNSIVLDKIENLLRAELEPQFGKIEFVRNVDNDKVQRLTGMRWV